MAGLRDIFKRKEQPQRFLGNQPEPMEQSGIILGHGASAGRGFEVMPRDPNYPNEIPEQTKRRLEHNALMEDLEGDPTARIARMDEFADPSAAMFPVNASGNPVVTGYGAGYNKGPLDVGYQAPQSSRPRKTYNTTLSPEEEMQFQKWKQEYAPSDTGEDYDLRGAFKTGLRPDPKTGHWPDTFKKPNHPTFSNQSQYAVGSDAAKAGHWEGDTFIPPRQPLVTRPKRKR